jgi:GDP-D-mannose 3', 5'-epimerase
MSSCWAISAIRILSRRWWTEWKKSTNSPPTWGARGTFLPVSTMPRDAQLRHHQPEYASAYPAAPDSEYGWEKLFSEWLYLAYMRNHGIQVRVARFHNIFGTEGTWRGGREKSPAALCRKVAEAPDGGEIEIWGDGKQTRSFLYVDECVEGLRRLMDSDFSGPVNIGSEEMVTINRLAEIIMDIAGKKLTIRHIPGPLGVRGRKSDNRLIQERLGWAPCRLLREGLSDTYAWIAAQVAPALQDVCQSDLRHSTTIT